ncbi:hypothetical protein LMG27174_01725 [Paraburkholderia rhynchosiae]|uniref:Uncharacterized protein n=1 Tax=Paraburkholderia rhynchosiae TaxID=487049 RepID=A0A6J5ABD5_9BURK|nr:hypothetical protein LMG27174_01725 [Paraburkholderia rhynchosiae]
MHRRRRSPGACADATNLRLHARSYALRGQPWVRDTLCLRSSQFAMKTAPSSPAPIVPAMNGARAAGLVVFSARPKAKQRPSNDSTLTSLNPRSDGRNSGAWLTCLNELHDPRSVAGDRGQNGDSRRFRVCCLPPTVESHRRFPRAVTAIFSGASSRRVPCVRPWLRASSRQAPASPLGASW